MRKFFVGIDVQARSNSPYAALDDDLNLVKSGWLPWSKDVHEASEAACHELRTLFTELSSGAEVCVGIDSPRQPLSLPREHFFRHGKWRGRRSGEKGWGRHCELVLKTLGIANPQWTPTKDLCPPWMQFGFTIFDCLQGVVEVYEVFPSASYRLLCNLPELQVSLSFEGFAPSPKDMLDAVIGAVTVFCFRERGGREVGGGDGLGTIVLPTDLTEKQWECPVQNWPG